MSAPIDMRLMETATIWLIREREGRADPVELEAWLNESPLHAEAYRRAAIVYRALHAPAKKVGGRQAAARRRAAVASLALIISCLWWARELPLPWSSGQITGVGETRALSLPDGSMIELNTNSAVSVDYDGPLRKVRLVRGEAWFDVARDLERPFVVAVDDMHVTVLGTKFNIHKNGSVISIGVAEGRVEVRDGEQAVIVTAGRAAVAADESLTAFDQPIARVAQWRQGWVGFEHATVGAVVDELSRYHSAPMFILSADVRERTISTRLNVKMPEQALRLALDAAGAQMIELPGGMRIIY